MYMYRHILICHSFIKIGITWAHFSILSELLISHGNPSLSAEGQIHAFECPGRVLHTGVLTFQPAPQRSLHFPAPSSAAAASCAQRSFPEKRFKEDVVPLSLDGSSVYFLAQGRSRNNSTVVRSG